MIGDGGHGKCCVDKSIYHASELHRISHKAYALLGDLDSLEVGGTSSGSTY